MSNRWENIALGEVCEVLDSRRKPITKRDRTAGEYPYYGATGILDYVHDYIFDEKLILIGEDGAKWGSGENTAFIADGKYWVNNHAHVIRPDRKVVLDNWLVYFLNFSDLSKYVTGLTVPKLNQAKMREISLPLPPISEQKEILHVVDKIFEKTSKAKENAEKNLQNARELFESYLQNIFANPGKDWEEKNLGDICEVIAGQSPEGKYYNNSGKGLPFYQGKKEFTEKYLGAPTTWTTNITKEAQEGDILMSVRAPVGPVNFSTSKICIGRGLAAIRASKHIDKEFLFSFLIKHKNEIVGNAGAVFNSISKTQIENILIPLPSISKQKIIVDKLITLSTETKRLEIVYQQKLADLEELKKSVLHKAFTGELAGACS